MANNITQLKPKNSKLMLISESAITSFAEKVKSYTNGKVKFSTILQTCDDVNQNKRKYPLDVMKEAVERIQAVIKSRSCVGELDHPIVSGESSQARQTTVCFSNASHLITEVYFRGNEIWGEVETLSTDAGRNMAGLVLDKVQIGFSLRGLADLEDNGTHQTVLKPLLIICWDCVQSPSHRRAVINEIYQEEVLMAVNESRQLLTSGKAYLPNVINQYVNKHNNTDTIKKVVTERSQELYKEYWK